MKTILIAVFFLGVVNSISSQDTIKFVNKSVQVVKVNEIGINEIKYHRYDNMDGPLYTAAKADIESIRFFNGHTESFDHTTIKPVVSNELIINSNTIPNNEKIIISGTKLVYLGKPMGEIRLWRLINNEPNQQKKIALLNEFQEMKTYKKKQYLYGFVGLGVGVILPYAGLITAFIFNDPVPLIVGVAAGISIGVTGAVISGINKRKRLQKKLDTAALYNN